MKWLDSLLLVDLFSGMRTTGRYLWKKKETVQYPEERREPSDRFRGMLRFDAERCIKCGFCAAECPIDIIAIESHTEKDEAGKPKKILDRYDIDVKRCMFCGLCEEACPTKPKSIFLTTKTYEMSTYERDLALYFDRKGLESWPKHVLGFDGGEAKR